MKLKTFVSELLREFHNNKIHLYNRINTLELECQEKEEEIKSDLYKQFTKKLNNDATLDKLKSENNLLRKKNKELKEIIKNGRCNI